MRLIRGAVSPKRPTSALRWLSAPDLAGAFGTQRGVLVP